MKVLRTLSTMPKGNRPSGACGLLIHIRNKGLSCLREEKPGPSVGRGWAQSRVSYLMSEIL